MCLCIGACIAQWILFILNFILSLFSLAILAIGVIALLQLKQVADADLNYLESAPVIIIVIGCVFSAIFFCGCCGAFCRNKCLLSTYSVMTMLLGVATIVVTIFINKGVEPAQKAVGDLLMEEFNNTSFQSEFQMIEGFLGCCGTTGPLSYGNETLPISCCPSLVEDLQSGLQSNMTTDSGVSVATLATGSVCTLSNASPKGCVDVFSEYVAEIMKPIFHVFIWITVIEFVSAFLGIFLACYVK